MVADVAAITRSSFARPSASAQTWSSSPPCKPASAPRRRSRGDAEVPRDGDAGEGVDSCSRRIRGPRLLIMGERAMDQDPRARDDGPHPRWRTQARLHHRGAHDLGELGYRAAPRPVVFRGRRRRTTLLSPVHAAPRAQRGAVLGSFFLVIRRTLHTLPAIEAITALRLALIPAYGRLARPPVAGAFCTRTSRR